MDTQGQLEAHERECALRYQYVQEKLEHLDKRMWRLEAMVMTSTVAVVSLVGVILMNFV